VLGTAGFVVPAESGAREEQRYTRGPVSVIQPPLLRTAVS